MLLTRRFNAASQICCTLELAPQIYGIIKYRDLYLYSDIDLWWNEYSIAYFYLYTAKV